MYTNLSERNPGIAPISKNDQLSNINPTFELPKTRGFKLAAINITSLPKYIDQLRIYMHDKPIDILAINETRLDSSISDTEMGIPGYAMERNDRNRHGGGVALYIKNNIDYELDDTLKINNFNLEWICVKVKKTKMKPFLVATWYRPPNSHSYVMDSFLCLLEKLESQQLEVTIMGDFNCDVSATPLDHHTAKLIEICNTLQYRQLIEQPTRVTKYSSSTIDLIISNNASKFSHYGTTEISISDHNLIFAVKKISSTKTMPKIIESRQYRKFNCKKFSEDLMLIPWELINNINDPNSAWLVWKDLFLSVSDKHAPLRRKRVQDKQAPWLTAELKKMMFERDRLKKIANRSNTQNSWHDYRRIKNEVNFEIKSAKIRYYNQFFRNNKNNLKQSWKGINGLLGTNPNTSIKKIECNNKSHCYPAQISNALNSHFAVSV